MNETDVQIWLQETLMLKDKLKTDLMQKLSEFMPDGDMMANMTEEQLRDEVEIDKSLVRDKLLTHIARKLREDCDYEAVHAHAPSLPPAPCVFLSCDDPNDPVARNFERYITERGIGVARRE